MFKYLKNKISNYSDIFVALITIAIFINLYQFGFMETYENVIIDKMIVSSVDKKKVSKEIVFLLTDDKSLKEVEKFYKMGWPWRRKTYKTIIDFLDKAGSKSIVFDSIFTEKSVYTYLNEPDDSIFSKSLSNPKVILATSFSHLRTFEEMNLYIEEKVKKLEAAYLKKARNIFNAKKSEKSIDEIYQTLIWDLIKSTPEGKNFKDKKDKLDPLNISKILKKIFIMRNNKKLDEKTKILEKFALNVTKVDPLSKIPIYHNGYTPLEEFTKYLNHLATVQGIVDKDAVVRKAPIISQLNNKYYPSLSLASYMVYKDIDSLEIKEDGLLLENDVFIPLNKDGLVFVKYYSNSYAYKNISQVHLLLVNDYIEQLYGEYEKIKTKNQSIEEIKKENLFLSKDTFYKVQNLVKEKNPDFIEKNKHLNYRIDQAGPWHFKDKIIIIADSSSGHFDFRPTPLYSKEIGAHLHATLVNNLINNDLFTEVRQSASIYLSIIFLPLILLFIIRRLSLILSAFISIGLIALVIGFFVFYFLHQNVVFDVLTIILSIFFIFIISSSFNYLKESQQKEYIQNAFSQYLSPKVIDVIIKDPSQLNLGGVEKDVSIFFSDIEGFSSISEKLPAKDIVQLLNHFLTEMCDIIIQYDGVIDKFIGDAIVAFWGAPLEQKDHHRRACFAAIDMQNALKNMQSLFLKNYQAQVKMRYGINSGKVVVGNMGSLQRTDYTVIGDIVNSAARLESVNKQYKTYGMISDFTYNFVKSEVEVREIDTVLVMGKKKPITLYELLARKNEFKDQPLTDILPVYNRALKIYKEQKFKEALSIFDEILTSFPEDKPSSIYKERCLEYIKQAPQDKNWLWHQLKSK